ncbi:transposase [Fulvivirgaceae bacterium BMA10]|uniref:Transposase n=1 Tax=Splendidivirga corallicola TaxID=3051826 RepID=A0ABT8KR00_9BACT|nr:transposase [Fulvivirgaceae bacterium BMA10]
MQNPLFPDHLHYSSKLYIFKSATALGKLHSAIPWDELAACLPQENRGPGAPRWFSAQGMFGLMFLKAYLNISDAKLIERFNTDYAMQLFCGKLLQDNERIKGRSIVSRIRTYIGENADWQQLQHVLLDHWKRDMSNTHVLLMDATCYESYIRFPTDVKLLWESCQWVFEKQLFNLCKLDGIRRPRSKYIDQKRKQRSYDRQRRKTYKQGQKRKKALLHLLQKGLGQLQELLNNNPQIELNRHQRTYLKTIKTVLAQQTFLQTRSAKELKDRIVSLPKPYIRPIIRGKENKRIEFGMKVHMLQSDGISYFDQISFNAFNETTRLKTSVFKHKAIFKDCHQLGADNIYPTNKNRKFLTDKQIFTCFANKGPKKPTKSEAKLKSILATQRATTMEGAFGIHKTAYGLHKIKAKNKINEVVWVFFGVMTANAVIMAKRKANSPPLQQVA